MQIKDTPLGDQAISIVETKFGILYFFKNFLITEIFEGMTLGKREFEKILELCDDCYDHDKPFGIVSHRLHSYAVNVFELVPIAKKFEMVVANAVVAYTDISLKNFELEQQILGFKGKYFNNLDSSIAWIKKGVKEFA